MRKLLLRRCVSRQRAAFWRAVPECKGLPLARRRVKAAAAQRAHHAGTQQLRADIPNPARPTLSLGSLHLRRMHVSLGHSELGWRGVRGRRGLVQVHVLSYSQLIH